MIFRIRSAFICVISRKYKSGKGIVAKFDGLLIKGLLAYRPTSTMMMDETLNAMKRDTSIGKAITLSLY